MCAYLVCEKPRKNRQFKRKQSRAYWVNQSLYLSRRCRISAALGLLGLVFPATEHRFSERETSHHGQSVAPPLSLHVLRGFQGRVESGEKRREFICYRRFAGGAIDIYPPLPSMIIISYTRFLEEIRKGVHRRLGGGAIYISPPAFNDHHSIHAFFGGVRTIFLPPCVQWSLFDTHVFFLGGGVYLCVCSKYGHFYTLVFWEGDLYLPVHSISMTRRKLKDKLTWNYSQCEIISAVAKTSPRISLNNSFHLLQRVSQLMVVSTDTQQLLFFWLKW